MCASFKKFCVEGKYKDPLIEMANHGRESSLYYVEQQDTFEQVKNLIADDSYLSLKYKSQFFNAIVEHLSNRGWVDIECFYFKQLKSYFGGTNLGNRDLLVKNLNKEFDFLIRQLINYIALINNKIDKVARLESKPLGKLWSTIFNQTRSFENKFLNFNYTETLLKKEYADEKDIINIHGRVSDLVNYPIIFGYGDEKDPTYQAIEDSGLNILIC